MGGRGCLFFCHKYLSLRAHLPHVHVSARGQGSFGEVVGPASSWVLPRACQVPDESCWGHQQLFCASGWRRLTSARADGQRWLTVASSGLGLLFCDIMDIQTPTSPLVASSLLFVGWFAVFACVLFYCSKAGGHLFLRERKEINTRPPACGPLCSELNMWAPRCSSPCDS